MLVGPLAVAVPGGIRRAMFQHAAFDLRQRALLAALGNGDAAMVERLLDRGARVNVPGSGRMPLEAAIDAGHAAVVKLLLAHGADPNARDPRLSMTSLMGPPAVVTSSWRGA